MITKSAMLSSNIIHNSSVIISWKKGFSANIEISVEDLVGKDSNTCKQDKLSCSEIENKKKCIDTCGIGTQGEG